MPERCENRSGMRNFRGINIDKTVSQWYNRCKWVGIKQYIPRFNLSAGGPFNDFVGKRLFPDSKRTSFRDS